MDSVRGCFPIMRIDSPSLYSDTPVDNHLQYYEELHAYPTWNKTLGPMQKKQSTMRKAKIIGMLLINLEEGSAVSS